jgi:N-acetylneuraminate synthase
MKGQKLFIDIGKRRVGPHYAPLVVAEIGINHGGDLSIAKEMVKAAALSGCECVKHQTHFVEDEMTIDAKSIVPPNSNISIWEIMENCSLSKNEELELKNYAENLGLIYISTPFFQSSSRFFR